MSYYKITFLTLSAEKIKDSKYAVTVFSRTNGKLKLIVNGIGKPKSRFTKLYLPAVLAKGLIYLSKEHGTFTLTDVEIIDTFEHLRADCNSLNALAYITILIADLLPEKLKIRNLLDDIITILKNKNTIDSNFALLYQFYLLEKLGYLPDLKNCTNCGILFENTIIHWDQYNAEFLCGVCSENYKNKLVKLNEKFTELFYIQKERLDNKELLFFFNNEINKNVYKYLETFINDFIMNNHKKCKNAFDTLNKIEKHTGNYF